MLMMIMFSNISLTVNTITLISMYMWKFGLVNHRTKCRLVRAVL